MTKEKKLSYIFSLFEDFIKEKKKKEIIDETDISSIIEQQISFLYLLMNEEKVDDQLFCSSHFLCNQLH